MKAYFTLALLLIAITLRAQDYSFGKVSKEELKKTQSDIDTEANAEILYKNESIYYYLNQEKGFIQKREVHLRIKIYNKEGLDWANHNVSLYSESASKRTKLYGEKGYTYNLVEGSIDKTKLNRQGVHTKDINEYWKEVSIALPNVREGAIIELKYTLESPFISIDDIYVQELIPIKKLDIVVKIPEYFNFKKLINPRASFYPKLIESTKRRKEVLTNKSRSGFYVTKTSHNYSDLEFDEDITTVNLENVPALKKENFVDNLKNYIAKIVWEYNSFKDPNGMIKDYSSNWRKVSETIYNNQNFGDQLKKTSYFKDSLDVILTEINDPMEKANAVFNFVKSNVKWNDYYGKYTIDGVKKAFKNRSGNIAEINLMLTSMLRYAGLNANPVLVSTKSHGIPITATLDGFNYVISALELQNKTLLLDASDAHTIPNVLPKRAINWQGRLVKKNGVSSWISLQQKDPVLDSKIIIYKITPNLNIEGKAREHKTLQLALKARKKESKLTTEEKVEQLENIGFDITVKNLTIKNEDKYEKPYIKSYDFASDELIEEIGDRLYISPLLFYTIDESPFKEETRNYPIDFIYPFKDTFRINITIPDDYVVEHIPASSAAKLSDNNLSSYKYTIKNNGKLIQLNINFDFNASIVSVDLYKDFREYFSSYLEKISEKIILKKIG